MKENKLIAEFMGYEECPMKLYRMDDKFQSVKIYSEYQDEDEYNTISAGARIIKFTPEQMEFHTSWDWLMPVVESIERLGYEFFIVEDRVKVSHNTDHSIETIIDLTSRSKLNATYNAVVEFINEYNKNK
jgi:cytochrome oxidase Cu insertion factor (SCO1/SenC/PrrC family)